MCKGSGVKYSFEVKQRAIEMKKEGIPVKEIQKELNIKSPSQVYTWWYWYQAGDIERLKQPIGKQYTFGHGPQGSSKEEVLIHQNRMLKAQVAILKKYRQLEREWFHK